MSALDHRPDDKENAIPDSSYLLYNIERLDQLLDKLGLFDVIFSQTTWIYLKDHLSALAIAYQFLKPGGVMYIEVHTGLLEKQGVTLDTLVQELKSQGYDIGVHAPKRSKTAEYGNPFHWIRLRKTEKTPALVFPYKIEVKDHGASGGGKMAYYVKPDLG